MPIVAAIASYAGIYQDVVRPLFFENHAQLSKKEIRRLVEESRQLYKSHLYERAAVTATEAWEAARERGLTELELEALHLRSESYLITDKLSPAHESFEKLHVSAIRGEHLDFQCRALLRLGNIEEKLGNSAIAEEYFENSFSCYESSGDFIGEANALNALGGTNSLYGKYVESLELYNEARSLHRTYQSELGEANSLLGLARLEQNHGVQGQANVNYDEALALFLKVDDALGIANVYLGKSELFLLKGDSKLAREYLTEAFERYQQLNNEMGIAYANLQFGDLEVAAMNGDLATSYYRKALEIFQLKGIARGEASARLALGAVLFSSGELDQAQIEINDALATLITMKDQRAIEKATKLLEWIGLAATTEDE